MKELVPSLVAATILAILLLLPGMEAASPSRIPLIPTKPLNNPTSRHPWVVVPRGGSDNNSDEYDSEDEEVEEDIIIEDDENDYESDDEKEEDVVMVESAVKATQKAQAKKNAEVKKTMSAKLSVRRKKPGLIERYVPYIVRACMNPATLVAMTKAYFASLFNLNYLTEVSLLPCIMMVDRTKSHDCLSHTKRIHRKICDLPWKKRPRSRDPPGGAEVRER